MKFSRIFDGCFVTLLRNSLLVGSFIGAVDFQDNVLHWGFFSFCLAFIFDLPCVYRIISFFKGSLLWDIGMDPDISHRCLEEQSNISSFISLHWPNRANRFRVGITKDFLLPLYSILYFGLVTCFVDVSPVFFDGLILLIFVF